MQQPGFNAYGAVDLGALAAQKAARERAEQARAEAGPDAAPPVAVEVTEETFQAEVVDRSMTVPVVIDFWAEWCGPCKQLSPVLEKLAVADGGRWVLATLDVDANPRIASAFQVQSIPAVFVVWQGQLVPGFQGALPEAEVRRFLDEVLRLAEGEVAAPVEGEPAVEAPLDPGIEAAFAAIERGDLAAAAQAYRDVLAHAPADEDARLGLAQVELMTRTQGTDPVAVRRIAADNPDDVDAQVLASDVDLVGGHVEDAFARLVDTVRRTAGADRERARLHLVGLMDVVGPDDDRVVAARRSLASALY